MQTLEQTRAKIQTLIHDDMTTLASHLPGLLLQGQPYLELMGEMVGLADLARQYQKPLQAVIEEPKDTGPVPPAPHPGYIAGRGEIVPAELIGVEGEMTTWLLSENKRAYRRESIHHPNVRGRVEKVLCLLYRNGPLTYDAVTELLDGPFRDRWASDYYKVGVLAALKQTEFVTIAEGVRAGVKGKAPSVMSLTALGILNVSKWERG